MIDIWEVLPEFGDKVPIPGGVLWIQEKNVNYEHGNRIRGRIVLEFNVEPGTELVRGRPKLLLPSPTEENLRKLEV